MKKRCACFISFIVPIFNSADVKSDNNSRDCRNTFKKYAIYSLKLKPSFNQRLLIIKNFYVFQTKKLESEEEMEKLHDVN